jgi:hypothetical protein
METKDIITIIISSVALIFSIYSIWISNLKPFKLKIYNDAPVFTLYKITPQISGNKNGETWWIPSFDVGISFNNIGKQSGVINDIRIRCTPKKKKVDKVFYFYAKWVVKYSTLQKLRTNRMKWANEAIIREWFSTILPGNSSKNLHIILENDNDRWDNKFEGLFDANLEVKTSKSKKWIKLSNFEMPIFKNMFEEKSSYTLRIKNLKIIKSPTNTSKPV